MRSLASSVTWGYTLYLLKGREGLDLMGSDYKMLNTQDSFLSRIEKNPLLFRGHKTKKR